MQINVPILLSDNKHNTQNHAEIITENQRQ